MGSGQSRADQADDGRGGGSSSLSPSRGGATNTNAATTTNNTETPTTVTTKRKKPAGKKQLLTNYQQVESYCRKSRRSYDVCYQRFYSGQFTSGQLTDEGANECDDLFDAYKRCYLRGIQQVRRNRGAREAKEGSLLKEFEEEVIEEE